MDGMILFAHGARDPRWAAPFERIAADLHRARPTLNLRLAYLEFMSPGFELAAEELVGLGCTRIHIHPMFLGSGGHVQRDLPLLLDAQRLKHGKHIEWLLHAPLGEREDIIAAMSLSCLQALSDAPTQGAKA